MLSGGFTPGKMPDSKYFRSDDMKAPLVFWFTGLSGAGKSTIANALSVKLKADGYPAYVLDGDVLRQGLCKDLKFSPSDRTENLRRIAEVAKLINDAGMHVIVATISPMCSDRAMAKAIIGTAWREIHIATSLEICEKRDVKGLYRRARSGKLSEFTGVSAPYEVPASPDISIDTVKKSVEQCVTSILSKTIL